MNALVNVAAIALAGASLVSAQAPEAAPCTSVVDAVTANGLGRLGEAVVAAITVEGGEVLAELATATEELPEDSKITLFAPEDAAWPPAEALPTGVELLAVLLGHAVPNYLPSPAVLAALEGGEPVTLPTVIGSELTAKLDGESIYVAAMGMEPGAKVVTVDVETCVGVIHVIDAVLLPTEGDMMPTPVSTMAPMPAETMEGDDTMEGTEEPMEPTEGTEDEGLESEGDEGTTEGTDSGESSTSTTRDAVVTESSSSLSLIAGAVSSAAAALALLF